MQAEDYRDIGHFASEIRICGSQSEEGPWYGLTVAMTKQSAGWQVAFNPGEDTAARFRYIRLHAVKPFDNGYMEIAEVQFGSDISRDQQAHYWLKASCTGCGSDLRHEALRDSVVGGLDVRLLEHIAEHLLV